MTKTPSYAHIAFKSDLRYNKLGVLFEKHKCKNYAKAYIEAADKYQIDWRLLAAISLAESTCGKHFLRYNLWGYEPQGSLQGFASIPQGIDYVSRQLGTNRLYRNKTNKQKLTIYNYRTEYRVKVLNIMSQISP